MLLSRTISKLSQIIVQIWDEKQSFCVLSPLWDLGATNAVHFRLIGKLLADSQLVISELFSLIVTAEVL